MRLYTALYNVVFLLFILQNLNTVTCQGDSGDGSTTDAEDTGPKCTVPLVQDSTLGNTHTVGDELSEGTTFDVTCNSGFQLGSDTVANIPCISDRIPKSCREVKIINAGSTEYVVGSEVKLTCQVKSSDQVTAIRWIKGDQNFRLQGEFSGASTDAPTTYLSALTFTVLSTADAGGYKCEAIVNSDAPFDKEMYQSTVQINILSTVMKPDENPVYLLIGQPFPLSCTFVNYASYSLIASWTQGTSPMTQIFTDDEGDTTTTKITLNAGDAIGYNNDYTCKGVYKHLGTSATLTVKDSRRIEVRGISFQPQSVTVGIGGEAVFTCDSVGETKGTVKWLVGGTLQDESLFTTTHTSSSRRTRSILTLESVEKQDSKVQCQVTFGDVTVQSDEVDLVVFGIGIVQHPKDTGFVRGTDNKLTCSVQTENDVVPTIRWFWGFSQVSTEKYSTSSNAEKTLYTSELFFEDVQTSANGAYKCKANFQIKGKNTDVESNAANVYVRVVMRIPSTDYVKSSLVGDTKVFSCFFWGVNEPEAASVQSVTWYVNSVDVKNVPNFAINNDKMNKDSNWQTVLTMTNISPKQASPVKCSYECGIGPAVSDETKLYVHRNVALAKETHTSSSTFTITCSSGTNEPAVVTWFEDGQAISLNDNNFKRQPVTTEDFVQKNRLLVQHWATTKDITTIKCKYRYEITNVEYETSTKFSFKGFTNAPARYTYYSPEARNLYCAYGFTYTTTGPTSAKWTRDGASVDSDPRYEVNVPAKEAGNWQISLTIKGSGGVVTIQDGGVFVCSFVYSDDEVYERTADVYFYDIETLPAVPKFYDAPSVTLTCLLKSKDLTVSEVKWMKGGKPVGEPAYTVTSESNSLTTRIRINEVDSANEGTFSCVFAVPGNSKVLQESMYAYIRNIEMLSEEYLVVTAGSQVELSCSVKNYTDVALVWYKDNGNAAASDHKLTYKDFILTSTLTLESVQTENLGEYRCGVGDSRSRKSSTVSSVSVRAEGDTVLKGSRPATIKCHLTGASSQPTAVLWTDDSGKEYKATDSTSDYKVIEGTFKNGDQTTTLEIDVSSSSTFTCKFLVDGTTGSRRATATIVDITTTPAVVHKGSDTKIQCRMEGVSTAPGVTWSGGDSGHVTKVDTADFGDQALLSTLEVKSVQRDLTYTCTYVVQGSNFAKEVQVQIYELSIPATYLAEKGKELVMEIQVQPELPVIASYVKETGTSENVTAGMTGPISVKVDSQRITVTYSSVLIPMEVTFRYTDSSDTPHTLTSVVHVVEFKKSKVSISDGVEEAELVCTMTGVLSSEMKKQVSSYWIIGGEKKFKSPTISGSAVTSKYDMPVTSDTKDSEVPCGFSVQGTEYSHTATLDIISISCPKKVDIAGDGTVELTCTISDSNHIKPVKAVWYKGSSQELIQSLTDAGWPDPVTTKLPDVSTAGSYHCAIDMGIVEFTRNVEVTKDGTGPVPVDPSDGGDGGDGGVDPEPQSNKNLPLIIGVTVPVVLVLIAVVVVGYCCFKKHRTRRASFNVKTLSMNSNSFNRPESLIYANDGQTSGAHRAARYTQHHDNDQAHINSNNLRVNYRVNNPRTDSRPQVRRPAPTPPSSGFSPSTRTDHVRTPDSAGVRYNRDFDASVYSRNLAAGKHLGPTQTSNA